MIGRLARYSERGYGFLELDGSGSAAMMLATFADWEKIVTGTPALVDYLRARAAGAPRVEMLRLQIRAGRKAALSISASANSAGGAIENNCRNLAAPTTPGARPGILLDALGSGGVGPRLLNPLTRRAP